MSNTDPSDMVENLRRLISDEAEADRLGRNGLDHSTRVLSSESCLARWDDVLMAVVGQGS
ncbi:glycosyltransferase family 4 protein [Streptomyces sp. SID10244]|nr:glycosyltransferase family 4 protein [Streptomyces sp. SID10244]